LEFFVLAGCDDRFAGAEAMFAGVLRRAGFAFLGSWSVECCELAAFAVRRAGEVDMVEISGLMLNL
jgi:hypothetical protein